MIPRIKMKLSDYALFLRGDKPIIHGSTNLLFGSMHDLIHTYSRAIRKEVQEPFVQLAEKIERLVLPDLNFFQAKLDDPKDQVYPTFKTQPTKLEVVGYVLDQLVGDLVDGLYQPSRNRNKLTRELTEAVDLLLDKHLKRTLSFFQEKQWTDETISYESIRSTIHEKIHNFL